MLDSVISFADMSITIHNIVILIISVYSIEYVFYIDEQLIIVVQ